MSKLFEDIGRRLRGLVEGLEDSARAAGVAATGEEPPAPSVERTADGQYRIGGFIFSSEAQARDFAERRKKRLPAPAAPIAAAAPVAPAPPAVPVAPAPVSTAPITTFSGSEQALMASHGVEPAANGGFRAGGYIFSNLDQAVSWAKRRQSATAQSGPRLMSDAHRSELQLRNEPEYAQRQLDQLMAKSLRSSAHAPKPEPNPKSAAKIRWVAEPTSFDCGGFNATLSMVYVGKTEPYAYDHNSVIDPTLSVASMGDPYGIGLNYWPRYADLGPKTRRTYLEWLQSGRSSADIPIGYVFLFFYGLERRLLKDRAYSEVPQILREVRRLYDLHGHDPSFDRYAKEFISVAELIAGEGDDELVPTPSSAMQWELPLRLRVALGRKIARGEPLQPDDTLAWVLASPETYLRTPGHRCFEELKELWARRFLTAFPDGMTIEPPKTRIKHVYQSASANFTANVALDDLPDIAGLQAPVKRLRTMLEQCTDALDAYSRFLGRNFDRRDSLAAAILLPTDLHGGKAGKQLRAAREQLVGIEAAGGATVGAVLDLIDLPSPSADGKVPLPTVRQMATTLDLLGFGFEPDRRYGACVALSSDTRLELFACEGGGKVEPDEPAYVAARTMAEIGALAAVSDGLAVPVELDAICRDLGGLPGLGDVERKRLAAHAASLLNDPPKRKEAIKRLSALAHDLRQRILQSAVAAILADGRVLPVEVRFLEGLHIALGLPQEDVYALLHRASVSDDHLTTIAPEARTPGVPLPKEVVEGATVLRIDTSRLERIRNETLEVSGLLADIFVEEVEVAVAVRPEPSIGSRFERLDPAHADLLWRVVAEPVSVDDFETHAKSFRLLPEGAIETINEWGFDTFDETVIAAEDFVYVHEHLVDRLRMMGEPA